MPGDKTQSFVVVGAGAVGGFLGVLLHRAGYAVRFLVRSSRTSQELRSVLSRTGLTILGAANPELREAISPEEVAALFTEDVGCLRTCSCILVTTKRTSNAEVHRQLVECGVRCPVLFLQNGLRICRDLEPPPPYELIECVVHYNTVLDAQAGTITLGEPLEDAKLVLDGRQPSAKLLAACISRTHMAAEAEPDFPGVQCGKLLLNMTNAVNALSGLAIAPMLMQPAYRLVLAASISEARAAFEAAGMRPKAPRPRDELLLRHFVRLLRAPQWLFAATVGRKLRGRGAGSTSMAQDLAARRVPTEIDFLNGEVVRLGQQHGVATPVNGRLIELVQEAEVANAGSPCISGSKLAEAVGLSLSRGGRGLPTARITAGGIGVLALMGALMVKALRARL